MLSIPTVDDPMRAQNGVGGPPEPRSSRRQEAHSISAEGSWSLLTSAATTVQGRNRLKGDGRETAQRSLSPADARQFPPGGRPADERSTGSLLINRFEARRKYRRAPADKPILAGNPPPAHPSRAIQARPKAGVGIGRRWWDAPRLVIVPLAEGACAVRWTGRL